jgi:hypothetical protein
MACPWSRKQITPGRSSAFKKVGPLTAGRGKKETVMATQTPINASSTIYQFDGMRKITTSNKLEKAMFDFFEYGEDRWRLVKTVDSWIEIGEQVKRGEDENAEACGDNGRQAFVEYIKRISQPVMEFHEFVIVPARDCDGWHDMLCAKDETGQLLRLQRMQYEWGWNVHAAFRLFACKLWLAEQRCWRLMLPEEY